MTKERGCCGSSDEEAMAVKLGPRKSWGRTRTPHLGEQELVGRNVGEEGIESLKAKATIEAKIYGCLDGRSCDLFSGSWAQTPHWV